MLDIKAITPLIALALQEDVGKGDATSAACLLPEVQGVFHFVAREEIVVCGLPVVALVYQELDHSVDFQPLVTEGDKVVAGAVIARVSGAVVSILTGERVALNFLQRMCGIASETRRYVKAVAETKATIRDTRKTLPGHRWLDKYAVRMGGGQNHRHRLDDGILIKDNHIAAAGGAKAAFLKAQAQNLAGLPIQIECDTLAQLEEVLAAGATMVLLDNMPPEMLRQAVAINAGRAQLEASGGITLKNVSAIAGTGVDYIAIGALTHSVIAADIGLDALE